MLDYYKEKLKIKGEAYLRVKVYPSKTKNRVREVMADGTIKIDIAAAPVKGRANLELIKFLAREFAVSKNNVKIISGAGERTKLVKIIK